MKPKLGFACVTLLAAAAMPAWALQLGRIEVKSALNQTLVASIPLHPESLTELEGLQVGLASPEDFARAGLEVTAADRTLRFSVVTDNNGQKLILVTSSQPITAPYLDFIVQVDTRNGKQLREYVVLLNPVIEAPPPVVQNAPVAAAAPTRAVQPATPAPASSLATSQQSQAPQPQPTLQAQQPPPQPEPAPQPQPAPQPEQQLQPPPASPAPQPQAAQPGMINVQYGDTLSEIAEDARGSDVTLNQMMLALKAANPEAFFKDNINDLKAGAILRIPTREEVDRRSVAEASAEVRRQYAAWRATTPHPATVVEGAAEEAAAKAAPGPGKAPPASDHLTLVAPAAGGNGSGNHAGVAGGTGNETVAGLQQQLKNASGALVSLKQSNADLESRLRSLEDIADKSSKLLRMKDATIAGLQRNLAEMQSGGTTPAGAASVATVASVSMAGAAQRAPASAEQPPRAERTLAAKSVLSTAGAWYQRPVTWIVAGLVILGLVLLVLFTRRRPGETPIGSRGPLADPDDVASQVGAPGYAASLQARLEENPDDLAAHLALCRLYHAQGETARFFEAAEAMRPHVVDTDGDAWREVVAMGAELAPPVQAEAEVEVETEDRAASEAEAGVEVPAAAEAKAASDVDPYGLKALRGERDPVRAASALARTPAAGEGREPPEPDSPPVVEQPVASIPVEEPVVSTTVGREPVYNDDPVDTKLDLARAYLDMGDPVGARAMLEEVLEEGSQMQKDQASRLLAEVAG